MTMEAARWRAVPPTHVQVAGVAVRDKAIADLALLLSQARNSALAGYVGQTWDQCRPDMPLRDRDCADILTALEPNPPAELKPLYEALRDRIGATRSATALRSLRDDASLAGAPLPAASNSGS
jgi:hypothetical protein